MDKKKFEAVFKAPPIYRKFELFTVSLVLCTHNLPKVPMIQQASKRLMDECLDCQTALSYAYCSTDLETRLQYLEEVRIHILVITSILRCFQEFSTRAKSGFMTLEQHAKYIKELYMIEDQRAKWATSTIQSLKSSSE